MHFDPVPRRSFAVLAALAAVLSLPALAQNPPPSRNVARRMDSGWLENREPRTRTIFSMPAAVEGSSWLRLHFAEISLPEHGAKLVITSVLDGGRQMMSAKHCREWRNSTAYFNGDDVQVEILAEPGSGPCRVVLERIVAGLPPPEQLSQCGPTDDRVLSSDPRSARLLPVGCTAFLIDDCAHSFLTAGHCSPSGDTAQFNVPLSNSNGSTNNPPPEDQYAVDPASILSGSGAVGDDWAYFGCFPNTNTGLRPFQRQQATYVLAQFAPSTTSGVTARVTGYGADSTPNEQNQVQQTATGPYGGLSQFTIVYEVDIEGGNSGSAVQWEEQGLVIGIATHGACVGSGVNLGTAIHNSMLQAALDNPIGSCVCRGEANTYCVGKVNSQGCLEAIGFTGTPSATGGAGSFSITATNILNHRLGILFYSYGTANTPYAGGTRCIAAPLKRTGPLNSGGSTTGTDCTGTYAFDMGARILAGVDPGLVVGATAFAQYFSRDAASPSGPLGLTEGLQFTIGP